MTTYELFNRIKEEIIHQISFLEDKPEETLESTIKALWLKAYGIPTSAEEAVKTELPVLSEKQQALLKELIQQRLSNIPLAHITGRQKFMGIEMLSDSRALIPRKETEILANASLGICKTIAKTRKNPLIFDICCGSGNLGLALSHFCPYINVFSSDLSIGAVSLASENCAFLNLGNRVTIKQGDLFEPFESETFYGKVDLIVCNPPYISTAKVNKMNTEIANYEPSLAFDGGMLGTKIIQKLIQESPRFLVKGGSLIFEVGLGQGEFISELCKKTNKFSEIITINDSSDKIRVIHCII